MMLRMRRNLELSYAVSENAKWYNYSGKLFGNFLKTMHKPTTQHPKKKKSICPHRPVRKCS